MLKTVFAKLVDNLALLNSEATSQPGVKLDGGCGLTLTPLSETNPASGLPMLSDAFDAAGNVFGTSDGWS